MPPPLDRNMYPDVANWEKKQWDKWVKEQKERGLLQIGVPGKGVNSSWMVSVNGIRVDLDRQQEVLAEARRTWVTMVAFEVDLQVHRYTPIPTLDFFRARMESMFEELRLCAGHWKTDRVWTENFSSWYSPSTPEAKPQNDGDEQPQDDGDDQPQDDGDDQPQDVRPQPPLKKVSGFRLPHKTRLLFTCSSSLRPAEDDCKLFLVDSDAR